MTVPNGKIAKDWTIRIHAPKSAMVNRPTRVEKLACKDMERVQRLDDSGSEEASNFQ